MGGDTGAHRRGGLALRRVAAPGRVNLIGEHTDYSGGLVLPVAIDRRVRLDVEPAAEIVLTSDRAPEPVRVPADGSRLPAAGWGRYVAAVAAELHAIGRPPVGMRGAVTSDLPDGSGLSSSAALEVAVAVALCRVADHDLPPLQLAAAAQRAELRAVGVPCGIMDQAAALLGRAGHALLLDCATLAVEHVPLPAGLALLVVDSGVRRRLAGSGYARRRAELEAALPALGGRRPADVDPEDVAALARRARLDPLATRRLRHVVTENARVRAVAALLREGGGGALETAVAARLGRLFAAGHASLRDDYDVSTPELDLLVELAGEEGAVAARLTGAGFGGAVVVLVSAERADAIGAAIAVRYGRSAQGRRATVLRCVPADGASPER